MFDNYVGMYSAYGRAYLSYNYGKFINNVTHMSGL